jgi:hypothetical protein
VSAIIVNIAKRRRSDKIGKEEERGEERQADMHLDT